MYEDPRNEEDIVFEVCVKESLRGGNDRGQRGEKK